MEKANYMRLRKFKPIPLIISFFTIAVIILLIVSVEEFHEGVKGAIVLIVSADPEIMEITLRSIYISGTAAALAIIWSIPTGLVLGLGDFVGKGFVKGIFNALLGIPTVALGLILYLLLSSSGPLGFLDLFINPLGVAVGQAILITPMMISFTTSAVEAIEPDIKDLAKTLGASEVEAAFAVLKESTSGVALAVMGSFNRAIAELGVAFMIGQNVRGSTRVLTTAIAMETGRGEIALSIALASILLVIVLSISLLTNLLQRRFQ